MLNSQFQTFRQTLGRASLPVLAAVSMAGTFSHSAQAAGRDYTIIEPVERTGAAPGAAVENATDVRAPGSSGPTPPAPSAKPAPIAAPPPTKKDMAVPDEVTNAVSAKLNANDYPGAIAIVDDAIKSRGDMMNLRILRSGIHCRFNRIKECEEDATRAVSVSSDHADAYLFRARVRGFNKPATSENTTAALADFAEAERRAQNPAPVLFYRGIFYRERNDIEKALADFTAAVTRDAKHAGAHQLKTALLYDIGRYDAALEAANAAIQNIPKSGAAYGVRALIALSKNDLNAARLDVNKANAIDGKNAEHHTHLANTAISAATIIDKNGLVTAGGR
jgi:tetratricopeptide (TPR) repeat protein